MQPPQLLRLVLHGPQLIFRHAQRFRQRFPAMDGILRRPRRGHELAARFVGVEQPLDLAQGEAEELLQALDALDALQVGRAVQALPAVEPLGRDEKSDLVIIVQRL